MGFSVDENAMLKFVDTMMRAKRAHFLGREARVVSWNTKTTARVEIGDKMIGSMCVKDSIEKDSIVMLDMTVDVTANFERPNEGWGRTVKK
jgi:hypothetical protein